MRFRLGESDFTFKPPCVFSDFRLCFLLAGDKPTRKPTHIAHNERHFAARSGKPPSQSTRPRHRPRSIRKIRDTAPPTNNLQPPHQSSNIDQHILNSISRPRKWIVALLRPHMDSRHQIKQDITPKTIVGEGYIPWTVGHKFCGACSDWSKSGGDGTCRIGRGVGIGGCRCS